jgi:ornithine decarboxylase
MSCGVQPKNIIFANPCKSPSFIRYVKSVGVDLMTFDNEEELIKISSLFSEARLVLRIKADDSQSTSKLGLKFGADVHNFEFLLSKAKSLNLNIVGVAFHVGSGCQSTDPYLDAIEKARIAFDIGMKLGFKMNLLDIGGGFPGSDQSSKLSFERFASVVNQGLDKHFPITLKDLTIIAEPGRYFAMSALSLFTLITSKKIDISGNKKLFMYYITDGLYGSFSSVATGNKIVEPIPLLENENEKNSREYYPSIVWGPTCDSYDCVRRNFEMLEMKVGEWLMFRDMGSYSISPASHFNGMPLPKVKVFVSNYAKDIMIEMKNWHRIEKIINSMKF